MRDILFAGASLHTNTGIAAAWSDPWPIKLKAREGRRWLPEGEDTFAIIPSWPSPHKTVGVGRPEALSEE